MAKIAGDAGEVTLGGTIKITAWECTVEGEVIDVTDSGDTTWKEFIPSGWTSWSGSFEGYVETGDAGGLTVGAAAAELILTAKSGVTWTGNAIVTSSLTNLVVVEAEAVKVAYTFQGTGILTPVNA